MARDSLQRSWIEQERLELGPNNPESRPAQRSVDCSWIELVRPLAQIALNHPFNHFIRAFPT